MERPVTIGIGIGAQASGTTWLAGYLSRHPQVHFPPHKELHYFERLERLGLDGLIEELKRKEGTPWQVFWQDMLERGTDRRDFVGLRRRLQQQLRKGGKAHSAYLDYLSCQLRPQHKVMGEFTPAYATCKPETLREILGLGSDVRLIYILRDPVAREWSSVKKAVLTRCGRDRKAAEQAIRDEGMALPELDKKGVLARTLYGGTLEMLKQAVPPEKLLVLYYEEFFRNRDTRPVTDFLGIDPMAAVFEKVSNPGVDVRLSPELRSRLYARLKDQYTAVESFMGYIPDEWRQTMKEAA